MRVLLFFLIWHEDNILEPSVYVSCPDYGGEICLSVVCQRCHCLQSKLKSVFRPHIRITAVTAYLTLCQTVRRVSTSSPWCRRAWRCGAACGTAEWWKRPLRGSWTPQPAPSHSGRRSRSGRFLAGKSPGLWHREKSRTYSHNGKIIWLYWCTLIAVCCL